MSTRRCITAALWGVVLGLALAVTPRAANAGGPNYCNNDSDCTNPPNATCFDASCVNNACEYKVKSCDDGNACTSDSCNTQTGCDHIPINCDDNNACTDESCDTQIGCLYTNVDCDDHNACTDDSCDAQSGCFYTNVNCDDSDACTHDDCNPGSGCEYHEISCNDGNGCTNDSCDSQFGCQFVEIACDDFDPCTDDSCDLNNGCTSVPKNCDDGLSCTIDSCQNGTCVNDPISLPGGGNACQAPSGTPVAGSRLRVDDVGPSRGKRNAATLTDTNIDLTGLDPTSSGATAVIGKPGGPSVTIQLPKAGWTKVGNASHVGYKYKARDGNGVLAARLRDHRSIRFSARGSGLYGLGGVPQSELAITVHIGSGAFCGDFGGTIKVDDGGHFFAVGAPAPASCPSFGN
jgi:hypothetical protein